MLRRLHPEQPESFAFTPANQEWAEAQLSKFPEGRQASAIIPLLWRAQEQEGWLSRPAIETVCDMLGLAHIRGLEVATFYFMFQLQPVGSIANIQICGTTSCMICGAEDLVGVCREKIAALPHQLSEDGKFSWEEVECLGACANAPMAQIGKDYYEDLTAERLAEIIDELAAGQVPVPGPQNGRYAAEPLNGLSSLREFDSGRRKYNASVQAAVDIGDTVKRIDGTEVPLRTPWLAREMKRPAGTSTKSPKPTKGRPVDETGISKQSASAKSKGTPKAEGTPAASAPLGAGTVRDSGAKPAKVAPIKGENPGHPAVTPHKPERLSAPGTAGADDLKRITGIGPRIEQTLNDLGIFHFEQIANWSPAEVAWVNESLNFKGRIERDGWIAQAETLAAEQE